MKTRLPGLVLIGLVPALSLYFAHAGGEKDKPHTGGKDMKDHEFITLDKLKWDTSPVLPSGALVARVSGDPTKAGSPYVFRIKLPDGFKVPPHWHPVDENATVLKGALLMGIGEKFDPDMTMELKAGSFVRMAKGTRHFATTKGETIIQVHGIGPFEINYVNPADDPRKKK
jgi:quercetin dioxygenase-like cupin family protein